jgi:hypothetical protein
MYLTAVCWLEASLHSEGPATAQLDQGFLWFFLGPRESAKLTYKFHISLYVSHAAIPMATSKFLLNVALPMLDQNVTLMQTF